MKPDELRQKLLAMQDIKYQQFHGSLLPGIENIIGVRVPLLRKTAAVIAAESWQEYLDEALPLTDIYYEETVMQGLVITLAKMPLSQKLEYITRFLPKINNWAVCDIFCATLKEAKKYPDRYWQLILDACQSEAAYTQRFAAVMLLTYFTDDSHVQDALNLLTKLPSQDYYVRMAVAWAVSIFYIQQSQATLPLLQSNTLDTFTHNKAIQKICESRRISTETKQQLRLLKRR